MADDHTAPHRSRIAPPWSGIRRRRRLPRRPAIVSALLVLAALSVLLGKALSGQTAGTPTLWPVAHSMREILVAAPTELGLVTDKGFRVLDTDEMMGAQAAGIERGDVLVSIAGVSMRAIAQVGPQALLTPLPAPPTPLPVVRRAAVPGRTIPLPAGQEEPYVPTPAERADTAVMNFVRALLVQSNGQPVPVVIRRGNQQLTLQVTPGPIIPAPGKPRPTPVFAGRGLYYF